MRGRWLTVVVGAAALALSAHAGERITLRNGFEMVPKLILFLNHSPRLLLPRKRPQRRSFQRATCERCSPMPGVSTTWTWTCWPRS